MTPRGNGQRARFSVHMSEATRELLRALHRQEAEAGRGRAFVGAFRHIIHRLQYDPMEFGEPLYRLPVLHLVVRQGSIARMVVDYAVYEDRPLVFIRGITLLS
jgi:hypothetical protein